MKKAIIFDNEDVIVHSDWDDVAKKVADALGLSPMTGMEYKDSLALGVTDDENIRNYWSKGKIDRETFWGKVVDYYGIPVTEQYIDMMSSFLEDLTKDVDQGVVDVLKRLKDKGYGLVMLSNAMPEVTKGNRKRAEQNGDYFGLFDKVLLSYEIGARKPEPDSYKMALFAGGVSAEEAVFVDNKPLNIDAALAAGIDGVCWRKGEPIEKLVNGLRQYGVDV